jgi:PhnB protein
MANAQTKLNTYLNYGGNCEEAFRFYEKHLGGKITMKMTQNQNPETVVAPELKDSILYMRMELGDTAIMASDVDPKHFQPMRSAYLSFSVPTSEEAERVWKLLTDGGEIFMPMRETFFAHRFGVARDRFGTSWMVIHDRPSPSA